MKRYIIILVLLISICCWAAWDNDKPADNQTWNNAAGDIRANNDALEVLLGVDLDASTVDWQIGDVNATDIKTKSPWVDVRAYGAVGDGTTDDTTTIQAAIDAAGAGGVVLFPDGTYLITSALSITSTQGGITLQGTGKWNGSIIQKGGNCDMLVIGSLANEVTIRSLTLKGVKGTYTGDGITIDDAYRWHLEDVLVDSCEGDGLEVTASWQGLIENCQFANNGSAGVRLQWDDPDASNSVNMYGCWINDNTSWGVITSHATCFNMNGCTIEDNAGGGIQVYMGYEATIHSCYFEGNTGEAIEVYAADRVGIRNCHINADTYGVVIKNDGADYALACEVSSCYITASTKTILLYASCELLEVNCTHVTTVGSYAATAKLRRLDPARTSTWIPAIAADDATPDVSEGNIFVTSVNTGATAITDLDNPVIGQIIYIVGGSNTNSSTIADSGNFNLSASWTASLDDVLILLVQADNDYIELGRVNN